MAGVSLKIGPMTGNVYKYAKMVFMNDLKSKNMPYIYIKNPIVVNIFHPIIIKITPMK